MILVIALLEMLNKQQEHRISPLFRLALIKGEETAIVLHLRRGAPLDGVDNHGHTPLMIAARLGRRDLCELLMAEGADPSITEASGASAADIAEREGWHDLCVLIRSKSAPRPTEISFNNHATPQDEEAEPDAWIAEELFEEPAAVGDPDDSLKTLQKKINDHRFQQPDDEWQLADLVLPSTSGLVASVPIPPELLRLFEASLLSGVTTKRLVSAATPGYNAHQRRMVLDVMAAAGIRLIRDSIFADLYDTSTEIFRNSASARELAEDLHSFIGNESDVSDSYITSIANSRVFNAERETRVFARLKQAREDLLFAARELQFEENVSLRPISEDDPDAAAEDADLEGEEMSSNEEREAASTTDEMILAQAVQRFEDPKWNANNSEGFELQKKVKAYLRARDLAVEGGLKLVPWMARRYKKIGMPLEDLIQEGNIGLIRAVEKFDPQNGARFGTYATWWIRQAITRSISDRMRTIRIPAHLAVHIGKFRRFTERFQVGFNRNPDEHEISAGIDVTITQARRLRFLPRITSHILNKNSLRQSVNETFEIAMANELRSTASIVLGTVTAREERVLRMRFGFFDEVELTLEEVGQVFDVTRERIRQIEAKALRKLKHPSRSRILRSYLDS
jgi:RNA polymerase sigma factor (sigma-70 family)